MKQLRVWYTQPGVGGYTDCYFTPLLKQRYEVIITNDNPDYVITSTAALDKSGSHFDFPCAIKIFFCGENIIADLNLFDYAIGFDYLTLEDRYFRLPLWVLYWNKIKQFKNPSGDKFCNFIYSNNVHSDPIRATLFDAINEYKKVDSGGGFKNNIGYRVGDKLDFIKDYKFTIAVENSSVCGYTTEKLLEPLMMGSMPIYWGNPKVDADFNVERFVWIKSSSHEDINCAIEEIKFLDANEDAYHKKCNKPIFLKQPTEYEKDLNTFLWHIFDQEVTDARRRTLFGFNRHLTLQKQRMERLQNSKISKKLFGFLERISGINQKSTIK